MAQNVTVAGKEIELKDEWGIYCSNCDEMWEIVGHDNAKLFYEAHHNDECKSIGLWHESKY